MVTNGPTPCRTSNTTARTVVINLLCLLFLSVVLGGCYRDAGSPSPLRGAPQDPHVLGYRLTITQLDTGLFTIRAEVDVFPGGAVDVAPVLLYLPERTVDSRKGSKLLRELDVGNFLEQAGMLRPQNQLPPLVLTDPSGTTWQGYLCTTTDCPTGTVEVLNLHRDALYEIFNASDIERSPYLDRESITWTVRDTTRNIKFTYWPESLIPYRKLLGPVAYAQTWGAAMQTLIGLVVVGLLSISVLAVREHVFKRVKKAAKSVNRDKELTKTPDQPPASPANKASVQPSTPPVPRKKRRGKR